MAQAKSTSELVVEAANLPPHLQLIASERTLKGKEDFPATLTIESKIPGAISRVYFRPQGTDGWKLVAVSLTPRWPQVVAAPTVGKAHCGDLKFDVNGVDVIVNNVEIGPGRILTLYANTDIL